jgi:TolA-binding protein
MRNLIAAIVFFALTAVTPSVVHADAGDDQFTVAAGHYSTQRWQLAAEEFQKLVADYPDHPKRAKAEFFLGEALVQLGKSDLAFAHFSAVLEAEPQGRHAKQALFRAGECAVLSGKMEEAREALLAFHKQYKNDPLNAYVLNFLGELALAADNPGEARSYYTKAIDAYPSGPTRDECRVGLAQSLIRLKEYDAADELLATLVTEKHLAVEALYWRGQLYRVQKRWEAAAATLSDAIDREPNHPAVEMLRYHAADALLRANRAQPAIDLLRGERELSAVLPTHRYLLAVAHQKLDQHEQAVAILTGLGRELEAEIAVQAELALAASLVALDKRDEAIESLAAALTTDAAKAPTARLKLLAQLANLQARAGQANNAQTTLQSMIDLAPDSETTLQTIHTLADIALKANDTQRAEQLFTRLAEHSSKQHSAKGVAGLTRLATLAGDPAKAVDQFEELIERFPDDPRTVAAALARASALEEAGQYDAALAVYKLVIDKRPNTDNLPLVLLRAAHLHDSLSQEDEAIKLYERLADEYSQSEHVAASLYGWAWCLLDQQKPDEAHAKFLVVHKDHAQSDYWADATYRLAHTAAQQKKHDEALALLGKLIDALAQSTNGTVHVSDKADEPLASSRASATNPLETLNHARYLRAQVCIHLARWEDAERDLKQIIEARVDSPLVLPAEFLYGDVAYRGGDYVAAKDRFDRLAAKLAGRSDRWAPMVPLRQAQVLAHQKDWQGARAIAEKITEAYPQFNQQYEVDYVLGRSYAAEADFEKAREHYTKVVRSPNGEKTETAAMAQWMIGESYLLQEKHEAALREYLRVEILYAYPRWQAAALLQAGKCYEALGKAKEAGELYSRLVKQYPSTEFVAEARERLSALQSRTARKPQR